MKTHLAVSKTTEGRTITSTLCDFYSNKAEDGFNSTTDQNEVNCKRCMKIIAEPTHWRHRKFLTN
jgi:hypothetical protein